MSVKVRSTDLQVLNMQTRMPFRYGIATLTALPHLMVRVELETDGTRTTGVAADGLAPKWFTKRPEAPFDREIDEMIAVVRSACQIAESVEEADTVFDLWQQVHSLQQRWGLEQQYPPLLWSLGVSLVERAAIEAFCRATETTFADALRRNTLGIRLGDIHEELSGVKPGELLDPQPLQSIIARHTVGLSDPLTDDEIADDARVDDGLPQSLAACIRTYGLSHFKLKISGEPGKDQHRLRRIAEVLEAHAPADFAFTLDGNEQFRKPQAFRRFWQQLAKDRQLQPMFEHLLFVEQPLHRDVALSEEAANVLEQWTDRPPIIIDESGGALRSFPAALECGYAGTSHKNCKGVIKGIASACLVRQSNQRGGSNLMLSGEDLANVGPIALLQDLAVMASLGIEHVERNGHHYFAGLSMWPRDVQQRTFDAHGDVYRLHEHDVERYPAVRIEDGRIDIASVIDAPLGVGLELDPTRFTPLEQWQYESLGLED